MEKQSITNTSSSSPKSSGWVRGKCIGRGCFGTVSTALCKSNGVVFAIKSVDLATCLPAQAESLENEISIFSSLNSHPHLVRFLGDSVSKEGTTSFRNLHMEYLPEGDVANSSPCGIDEILLRRYAWCLVSALRHVHSHGIVHCDVKSRNILVDGKSSVKLADFGSAIRFDGGKSTALITPRGSPLWMAPEVIRREYQGPESDVWSVGCTIIEMLTGKPAWEDHGIDSLSRIGFTNELPSLPMGISKLGRDFLDKCLKRDLTQRWSCDQLLQHPFLCQNHYSLSLTESSPRCVLDWVNSEFEGEELEHEESSGSRPESMVVEAIARINNLATTGGAIWESDGWVEVRDNEYPDLTRVESEFNTSPDLETNGVSVTGNGPAGIDESESESESGSELLIRLLLLVVENIQKYATFYTRFILILFLYLYLYRCCYHQCDDKKHYNKMKKSSLIHSLNFLFGIVIVIGIACDSDRTISKNAYLLTVYLFSLLHPTCYILNQIFSIFINYNKK